MEPHPLLKTPKLERHADVHTQPSRHDTDDRDKEELDEEDQGLVAMIAHRQQELETNKQRAAHYKSQVENSERRLRELQAKLVRLRSRRRSTDPSPSAGNGAVVPTADSPSVPPTARPQIVIPAPNPKTPVTAPPRARPNPRPEEKPRQEPPSASPASGPHEKKPKRMPEQREHQELIPSIRKSISPHLLRFQSGTHISSQHKRKLRCLVLSPANDQIFATSALDGVVNLWQVQGKGHGASLLSTTDCVSPKQRRWPEDITWHPDGDSLFAVYTADGGDSQISILNLNLSGDDQYVDDIKLAMKDLLPLVGRGDGHLKGEKGLKKVQVDIWCRQVRRAFDGTQRKLMEAIEKKVTFLREKPHLKGIINSILFMPWADPTFATGGSDHAVILWQEKDDSWKPKSLHREQHSSAVMGVAGLLQRKVILSVGADKRIVGYDLLSGRSEFKHQIESKCMSVLPNPCDFNLFMVQTGTPGKQLRLFDIRRRQTEIHAFGWKQESSESQSALINQTWSPDGFYLSSGSADPMIHIFDIRYSGSSPSQSVQAHQKRVFKAIWHQSLPLLTSISSDLNIGLHRII